MHNMQIFKQIDNTANFLFTNKKFKAAGDLLLNTVDLIPEEARPTFYSNARMSYFHAKEISKALEIALHHINKYPSCDKEIIRDIVQYNRYLGRYDAARVWCEKMPDCNEKRLFQGWFLMQEGKFELGVAKTEECRHQSYWWKPGAPNHRPIWNKTKCDSLVICGESGSGDEIIFSRWIPEIKKYCNNLYYHSTKDVQDVFYRIFDIKKYDESKHHSVDYIVPLMSIPFILKKDHPCSKKYLKADLSKVEFFDNYLPKNNIRIGINDTGDLNHLENHMRVIPLDLIIDKFKDLGQLVYLQKNKSHITSFNDNIFFPIIDNWEDTLAILENCDIIITACTSIAHAAGALGKKTIVISNPADYFTWCSVENGEKSIWYENVWCVRQKDPQDWSFPLNNAKEIILQELKR